MKKNKMYSFLYFFLHAFMWLFHPWEAVGLENLPEGGALLCGNHTTMGDPCYVACCVGKKLQLRVLAKKEIMEFPVLGFLLGKAGIIGVDREKMDFHAVKTCLQVLKNGEKLLMFPEGTRVREWMVSEAHTGAALFATRAGVPILPIYIPPKKHWFRRTRVIFGQPYMPEYEGKKPSSEDYQRIANDLMDRIRRLGGETG